MPGYVRISSLWTGSYVKIQVNNNIHLINKCLAS